MKEDMVDQLLDQWASEHPDRDHSTLGIVVRIQILGRLLQRQATAALTRHGLKHWEYDVLSVLRRQGHPFEMPATDIARAAMLTTGAMTTRIDGLVDRGLVRRRRSKKDGRSIPVRLTEDGRRLVDRAIETRLEDADSVLSRIDGQNKHRLAGDLRDLLLSVDA